MQQKVHLFRTFFSVPGFLGLCEDGWYGRPTSHLGQTWRRDSAGVAQRNAQAVGVERCRTEVSLCRCVGSALVGRESSRNRGRSLGSAASKPERSEGRLRAAHPGTRRGPAPTIGRRPQTTARASQQRVRRLSRVYVCPGFLLEIIDDPPKAKRAAKKKGRR